MKKRGIKFSKGPIERIWSRGNLKVISDKSAIKIPEICLSP
jgi:hypothetical protein